MVDRMRGDNQKIDGIDETDIFYQEWTPILKPPIDSCYTPLEWDMEDDHNDVIEWRKEMNDLEDDRL